MMVQITKFSQVEPIVILQDVRSIQKIAGVYEQVNNVTYNITNLPRIEEEQLQAHLYLEDDFVIAPKEGSRNLTKAKLGKLFIEFCLRDKGSFNLKIKSINSEARTLGSFLNLESPPRSLLDFNILLPISFGSVLCLNSFTTRDTLPIHQKEQLAHAFEIKALITNLLMNKDLTEAEKASFAEHYQAVFFPPALSEEALAAAMESRRDLRYFGRHRSEKPLSLFEVAAKIGALTVTNLSITENEVASVLNEYLVVTEKPVTFFSELAVQRTILDTLLENNRLPLRAFVSDIEELLGQTIAHLIHSHAAASTPTEAPAFQVTDASTTALLAQSTFLLFSASDVDDNDAAVSFPAP